MMDPLATKSTLEKVAENFIQNHLLVVLYHSCRDAKYSLSALCLCNRGCKEQ